MKIHIALRRLRRFDRGQATTEMVLLLPLLVILAGGVISVGYICWQGIKVQQAANLGARIQGQQRTGGGTSPEKINQENGMTGEGDDAPDLDAQGRLKNDIRTIGSLRRGSPSGVYGQFRKAAQDMFSRGENEKLFVPPPKIGVNTDEVKVIRVLNPPKIFNFKMKPVVLEATAYGGEDTRMYGLPRWGGTGDEPDKPFYQGQIKENR